MRRLLIGLAALMIGQTAMADNVADCEVFLRQPVMLDGEETGAFMDTYVPATDFIASIYDEEDGYITDIEDQPIKALFCTRQSVMPTLRDFPLVATGIPFVVSTDFDAAESKIVTIYYKEGKFHQVYKGPELSKKDQAKLDDAMNIFNLQPHGLGK
ncbi:MAG: hypothetical protein HKN36_10035 [Hellea sp.]|nr:hypothetical protein [Hellea sp.]